jgi:hypothetical protein
MAKASKKRKPSRSRKRAPVQSVADAAPPAAEATDGVGDVSMTDITPEVRDVMSENSRQLSDLACTESISAGLLDDVADESIHPTAPTSAPVKPRGWMSRLLGWAFGVR